MPKHGKTVYACAMRLCRGCVMELKFDFWTHGMVKIASGFWPFLDFKRPDFGSQLYNNTNIIRGFLSLTESYIKLATDSRTT